MPVTGGNLRLVLLNFAIAERLAEMCLALSQRVAMRPRVESECLGPAKEIFNAENQQADEDYAQNQLYPGWRRRIADPFRHSQKPKIVHETPLNWLVLKW